MTGALRHFGTQARLILGCSPRVVHSAFRILRNLAVQSVERLVICLGHRQARNRHCLAPRRLPLVLDLESSAWSTWMSTVIERNSATDSEDEPRESTVGCTPHPRRIAQTRHRYRRNQRGQVHRTLDGIRHGSVSLSLSLSLAFVSVEVRNRTSCRSMCRCTTGLVYGRHSGTGPKIVPLVAASPSPGRSSRAAPAHLRNVARDKKYFCLRP